MLNQYLENTCEGLLHACISSLSKSKLIFVFQNVVRGYASKSTDLNRKFSAISKKLCQATFIK